ncbi:MAG: hypothetical protein R6U17_08205 [Thermoplasmata archaeon]
MEKKESHPNSGENVVWAYLNKIIDYLENVPLTPLTAFIFLVIIGVVRSITESIFFEYPVFSMYLVVQHVAFNFPVLVIGVLILKLATDTRLKKVYTIIILGFVFVMLPPFIDHYILGLGGMEESGLYAYFAADLTFFDKIPDLNIVNMWRAEEISTGLKNMATAIMVSAGLYIIVKTKFHKIFSEIKNGMWKSVINKISSLYFGLYGIWFVIWFISAVVPTIFSFKDTIIVLDYFKLNIYTKYYVFMEKYGYTFTEIIAEDGLASSLAKQQRSLFITMFFFILTTSMMVLTLWMTHRDLLKKILRTIRKPIVFVTSGSALLGTASIHTLDPDFSMGWAVDPGYILHFPYVFYVVCIGFFLGCFASFISEYGKEDPELPKWASKHMSIVSLLAGGSFAFMMGPDRALIIFAVAAALIYLSFKDGNDIFSLIQSSTFGFATVLIFLLGVYTPNVWKLRIMDPYTLEFTTLNLSRTPPLEGAIMLLMFALFITVFIIAYFPKLTEKMGWMSTLPGSLILLPLFLLPAAVGVGLVTIGIIAAISLFVTILMDKDLTHLPLSFFGICLFVYTFDLWGYIPSVL